jgi:hypothetical protein
MAIMKKVITRAKIEFVAMVTYGRSKDNTDLEGEKRVSRWCETESDSNLHQ